MSIILRDYQQQIINKVRSRWKAGKTKLLVQAPTGAGKTVIFSYIAQNANANGNKVLIITHRVELLTETGGTLEEFGIKPFIVTQKTKAPNNSFMCAVAMTGTLKNRLKKQNWLEWFNEFSLIVIDETHLTHFSHIHQLAKNQYVLGFTATPKRSGSQPQLASEYKEMILGPTTEELIKLGFLLPDKYWGVPIDMSGVSSSNGDYSTSEMFKKFDNPKLYRGVVDNWVKFTPNTITIVFCCNIQHCIKTAESFVSAGISAKFISSEPPRPKTPENNNKALWTKYRIKVAEYEAYKNGYALYSGNRNEIIQDWKNGKFKVLINAGILTAGFNFKPTETIIMNRATQSDNLWLQCIGRGSRIYTGKNHFNILDFGSNAERLGHYQSAREYCLVHTTSNGDGVPAVKQCINDKCGCLVLASAQICPYCGSIFPKSKEQVEIELVQRTDYKDLSLDSIENIEKAAKAKQYKKTWIFRTVYFRLGEKEFKNYMRSKNYHWSYIYRLMGQYAAQHKKD